MSKCLYIQLFSITLSSHATSNNTTTSKAIFSKRFFSNSVIPSMDCFYRCSTLDPYMLHSPMFCMVDQLIPGLRVHTTHCQLYSPHSTVQVYSLHRADGCCAQHCGREDTTSSANSAIKWRPVQTVLVPKLGCRVKTCKILCREWYDTLAMAVPLLIHPCLELVLLQAGKYLVVKSLQVANRTNPSAGFSSNQNNWTPVIPKRVDSSIPAGEGVKTKTPFLRIKYILFRQVSMEAKYSFNFHFLWRFWSLHKLFYSTPRSIFVFFLFIAISSIYTFLAYRVGLISGDHNLLTSWFMANSGNFYKVLVDKDQDEFLNTCFISTLFILGVTIAR